MKQLSFEKEYVSFKGKSEKPKVNVTAEKAEHKRLKHQAAVIINMLRAGPVWTNELRAVAAQYNARLKEIRELLASQGLTVDCTFRGKDGNNRYEIKPMHGSRYQAKLMQRQHKAN